MKNIEVVENIPGFLKVVKIYSSSTEERYYLKIWESGDYYFIECTCLGFKYWKHCKHIESYETLLGGNT